MVFGIRDICDAVFRAHHTMRLGQVTFQKGQPVFTIETAKTSSLEGTSTTVYATGGRGNNNLIAWDGEKQITFNVEDATLSPQSFAVLANAGLIRGANGTTEETYIPMSSDTYIDTRVIDLTEFLDVEERITEDGMIYVMLEDEDHTIQDKLSIPVKVNTEEVDGVAAGKGLVPKAYDYAKPDENTFETLSQHEITKIVPDVAPKYKYEKLTQFTPKEVYSAIVNATGAEGAIYRVVEAFTIPDELKEFFADGEQSTIISYYQIVNKKLTLIDYENDYLILPQALTPEDIGKYYQVEKPFNTASNPEFFSGVGGEFKANTQVRVVLDGDAYKYAVVTSNEDIVGKPVYVNYYILQNMSNVDELQVAPEGLSGTYYVEARTLFRRKHDGVDLEARITIPNAHIQSNFTMQMDAGGDPSTFAFTVDCFPGYTYFNKKKKVLAILQIVNESKAEDKFFSVMKQNAGFTPEEKKWDSTTD